MGMSNQLDPSSLKRYYEGLTFLNKLLSEHNYAAADHLTIADVTLVASIAAYHVSREPSYSTTTTVSFYSSEKNAYW